MDLEWWPLFGLRVSTPRLVLRAIADDDLDDLCTLIEGGIHPADQMPFTVPWTDAPRPALQRGALQYHWRTRAEWSAERWRLPFGVWVDGRLVGQQDLLADDFRARRVVTSGSWLGIAHQGQGIGTEMRSAVLHLAFAGLGAHRAETEAFHDNPASLQVTAKLGYRPNGDHVQLRRDENALVHRFAMPRGEWEAMRRDDISIDGLEPAREMFGA